MAKYDAVPTEYKGIVYRSKSEAMFARYLELSIADDIVEAQQPGVPWHASNALGNHCGGFIYEPKGFGVNGWVPDFLVWRTHAAVFPRSFDGFQIPFNSYWLIEYKPSKPTKTYVKTLALRFGEIYKKCSQGINLDFSRRTSFYLYFGSVFGKQRGTIEAFVFDDSYRIEWNDEDWIDCYEEQIRKTRFDLEATNNG